MQAYPLLHRAMPIGVFDSGVGGLSVLRALRIELPAESFVYLADSAHAPYGEKGDAFVQQRSLDIARFFLEHYHIKSLVVACNTATAAAVQLLRDQLPELPIIGVEPAIKPAAAQSRTGKIGVLATRGTLASQRFAQLLARHAQGVEIRSQACDGLALAIEQSTLAPEDCPESAARIGELCQTYTARLGDIGGEIDTLVLGCTHYVFALPWLQALSGSEVQIIETGAPVARYTRSLLMQRGLLSEEAGLAACQTWSLESERRPQPPISQGQFLPNLQPHNPAIGQKYAEQCAAAVDVQPTTSKSDRLPSQIRLLTTGQLDALTAAADRWLGLDAGHCATADILQRP